MHILDAISWKIYGNVIKIGLITESAAPEAFNTHFVFQIKRFFFYLKHWLVFCATFGVIVHYYDSGTASSKQNEKNHS